MDTGLGVAARIHARVQVNLILVTALVIIVMLAVIGVFLVAKSNRPSTLTRSEAAQRRPALGSATVVASQATPPGDDNAADVDKLLARAGNATRQHKYLTPPGNSAFELYLRVLRLQPW